MITGKKSIRSLNKYTDFIQEGTQFLIGLECKPALNDQLLRAGLPQEISLGISY